jgi:hypothetical protein
VSAKRRKRREREREEEEAVIGGFNWTTFLFGFKAVKEGQAYKWNRDTNRVRERKIREERSMERPNDRQNAQ